jgi:arylsulfatase A-like enzyme
MPAIPDRHSRGAETRPRAGGSASRLPALRRLSLTGALGVILAGGFLACARPAPEPAADSRPRNVVIVLVDTLRQDHLQFYGYHRETAPTLGRLAAEGAVFDGISPTSWTKPAVASLLTGLHPLRHQAMAFSDGLPESVTTLAEVLSAHGYLSIGISGNSWTTEPAGFSQGFESLVLVQPDDLARQLAAAKELNRAVASLVPRLREPFFLYVHYVDPHLPYDPAVAWDGRPLPPHLARRAPVKNEQLETSFQVPRDPGLVREALDLYDGEIRQVDSGIAALLRLLGKAGFADNTLLVVTADHGEEFEEHGRMGHGNTLYEEVIRVPLIFHLPGRIAAGARLGEASLMDVFPTVLDLLALPDETGERAALLDGASRAAELRTGLTEGSPARDFLLHLDYLNGSALARRSQGFKLVVAKAPYAKELYKLRSDPGEQRNLWTPSTSPAVLRNFSILLADAHNALTRRALPRRRWIQGAQAAAQLRAIGYVGHTGDQPEPRQIPRRVAPPDPRPTGLIGWESLSDVPACVEPGNPIHSRYLIGGWHALEQSGRWTADAAELVVAAPPGGELVVRGISYRLDSFQLEARVDDLPAGRSLVEPGAFELRATFQPSRDKPWVLVRLSASPPLAPYSQGPEARTLGAFISSVCVARQPGAEQVAGARVEGPR